MYRSSRRHCRRCAAQQAFVNAGGEQALTHAAATQAARQGHQADGQQWLDAVYYAGVTLMVGFWLSISNDAAPVADWALFAASLTEGVPM